MIITSSQQDHCHICFFRPFRPDGWHNVQQIWLFCFIPLPTGSEGHLKPYSYISHCSSTLRLLRCHFDEDRVPQSVWLSCLYVFHKIMAWLRAPFAKGMVFLFIVPPPQSVPSCKFEPLRWKSHCNSALWFLRLIFDDERVPQSG